MAPEKATEMVLNVDLKCSSCYKKVKKVIAKIPQIRKQVFDVDENKVKIIVLCSNPEKIRDKLYDEGSGAIQSIEIIEKPKEADKPRPPVNKPIEAYGYQPIPHGNQQIPQPHGYQPIPYGNQPYFGAVPEYSAYAGPQDYSLDEENLDFGRDANRLNLFSVSPLFPDNGGSSYGGGNSSRQPPVEKGSGGEKVVVGKLDHENKCVHGGNSVRTSWWRRFSCF